MPSTGWCSLVFIASDGITFDGASASGGQGGSLLQRASMGSKIFSARYQQNPVLSDGNMIKSDWLHRYDFAPGDRRFGRVFLSCDPAGKAGQHNDYTSIAILGFNDKYVHLLHVVRGHWTVMQMHDRIRALAVEWRVGQILIEDTASGMGLLQILTPRFGRSVHDPVSAR